MSALMILSWCPGKSPCDPCQHPIQTTPGGWYIIVNQVVWPDYFGGPSITLATVHVGPGGYVSGGFNPTNPYPGKTMLYVGISRNVAYDSNPYYYGNQLFQTSDPDIAIANAQNAIANLP